MKSAVFRRLVVMMVLSASLGGTAGGSAAQDCLDYGDYFPAPVPVAGGLKGNGYCTAVQCTGSIACVAGSQGLLRFDITDVAAPVYTGRTDESLMQVAVKYPFAYGLPEDGGLQVIDISLPDGPAVVNRIPIDRYPVDVVQADQHLYTIDWYLDYGFFTIWDLSDPSTPQPRGGWSHVPFSDLEVRDRLAYLVQGDIYADRYWLQILDVNDPDAPRWVGEAEIFGPVTKLALAGHYAYVGGESGLFVIDVEDPAHPVVVGAQPECGNVLRLATDGTTLFAFAGAEWSKGDFLTLGLGVPEDPLIVGRETSTKWLGDLCVLPGHVYTTRGHDGLRIIDVSDLTHPTMLPWLHGLPGYHADVVATPDGVVSIAHSDGVMTLDLGDATAPLISAFLPRDGSWNSTCQMGTTLVWAGADMESARLETIDVSDLDAPRALASIALPYALSEMVSVEGYVFGTGTWCDLVIVDVRDPQAPVYRGQLAFPGGGNGVAASGSRVFLASSDGIRALDVTDHEAPQLLGFLPLSPPPDRMAVVGDLLYVTSSGYRDLKVVDWTVAAAPVVRTSLTLNGFTESIAASPPYLYLGGHFDGNGVQVMDISEPTQPIVVGTTAPGRRVVDLVLFSKYLVLAEGDEGLQVVLRPCGIADAGDLPAIAGTLTARPNPFNPRVQVSYALDVAGPTRLSVVDVSGRAVAVLHDGEESAGMHSWHWEGRDAAGRAQPSGVYVLRLETVQGTHTRKVSLLR